MEKQNEAYDETAALENLATAVAELAGNTLEQRQVAFLMLLDSACVLFLRSSSNAEQNPDEAREFVKRQMGKAFDRSLEIQRKVAARVPS